MNYINNMMTVANGDLESVQKELGVLKQYFADFPQKALNLGSRIILAIVFLFVGIQITKLVRKLIKTSLSKANADEGVIQFLDSFVKAILYIVLIFMIAGSFGADAASIIAILGSAGVAIGLALQGSLANFAGGVLILLLKPFKVGDYIKEDSKNNEGTVIEIQMFYTKLITFDGKIVVLPNGTLANNSLVNVTSSSFRRLDTKVSIAYEADLKVAKNILYEILNQNKLVMEEKEKSVVVDELADSAVILLVKCHVQTDNYWTLKAELLEEIKIKLDQANIKIPYPQLEVYVEDK